MQRASCAVPPVSGPCDLRSIAPTYSGFLLSLELQIVCLAIELRCADQSAVWFQFQVIRSLTTCGYSVSYVETEGAICKEDTICWLRSTADSSGTVSLDSAGHSAVGRHIANRQFNIRPARATLLLCAP